MPTSMPSEKRGKKFRSFPLVILFGTAATLLIPQPAEAARLRGFTVAPNWAFGSPQPVFISGCSDADAFGLSCLTTFPLGPVSDDLRIRLLGVPVGTEASLAENTRFSVFGLLESGNETLNDWWDLWIPTARWVGLGANAGRVFRLRDPGDVNIGDSITYANINNAAHILWASNNSDEATATLPADYLALLGTLVVSSADVTLNPDGSYDQSMVPPPISLDCTTDPACTPTSDYAAVPAGIPEPSTSILLGAGLLFLLPLSRWVRSARLRF